VTPMERVEKLRAATAKASSGNWRQDEWDVIEEDHESPIAQLFGDFRTVDANCEHIARWDPVAAGKVLDHLAHIFDRHKEAVEYDTYDEVYVPQGVCEREPVGWPCADYRASLAVLDALDGGGEQR
jgi:hypothetical protein